MKTLTSNKAFLATISHLRSNDPSFSRAAGVSHQRRAPRIDCILFYVGKRQLDFCREIMEERYPTNHLSSIGLLQPFQH